MPFLSSDVERDRLLDTGVVVDRGDRRRHRVLLQQRGLPLLGGEEVDQRQRAARVLRVDGDHAVGAAEDARGALALPLGQRRDLELALELVRVLAERVGVGPVAHERVLAGLPCGQRLGLHVGGDGLRRPAALDHVGHQLRRLDVLGRVDRRLLAVLGEHGAAGGEGELQPVAGQALVGRALEDDAALLAGLLIGVLPGRRRLVDLVGAVVDEGRVGVLRRAPDLALVGGGLQRRRDEAVLDRLDVGRQVVQPALRGELRGPDHVGAEHVAVGRLGLLALDELRALLVGRGRELDDLGLEALVGELLVEALAPLLGLAGRVLAGAVGDRALRALHRLDVDDLRVVGRAAPAATGRFAAAAVVAASGERRKRDRRRACRQSGSVAFDPSQGLGVAGPYPAAPSPYRAGGASDAPDGAVAGDRGLGPLRRRQDAAGLRPRDPRDGAGRADGRRRR